ncbi:MAG: hypothetical protein ACREXW_16565 [Gammaproteobacteria bacterium]
MTAYKMLFLLKKLPQNPDEADVLSEDITARFGNDGWELVSTAVITNPGGTPVLLLTLQKEAAG